MKLGELLNGIKILKSNANIQCEIIEVVNDSRKVLPGDAYAAIKGEKRDGGDYINDALKRGAVAVITENEASCCGNIPYVLVESTRRAICKMWSNLYGNPATGIKTVAITGTNGKTTSAYFLYNILLSAKIPCALISTVECIINGEKIEAGDGTVEDIQATMTTPEPKNLYSLYDKIKKAGVEVAVIEASSHALDQHRLDDLCIEIGAFTNLSREHLDYHSSMEEYFFAKKRLLEMSKRCVINVDDAYGKLAYLEYKEKSVGVSRCSLAEITVNDISKDKNGYSYSLMYQNEKIRIETRLFGEYNVYNSAIASSCALLLGVEISSIKAGILNTTNVKGRMEKYGEKEIYIDYAHTPTAMEKAIGVLREMKPGKRLIVLFGCGGNRDKGKRAEMGKVCSSLADLSVITSDNPRNENPSEIISDIVNGIVNNKEFVIIPSRKEAIFFAAGRLKENEVLLLLGKGHENYEINANGRIHFDEREVLDEVFLVD